MTFMPGTYTKVKFYPYKTLVVDAFCTFENCTYEEINFIIDMLSSYDESISVEYNNHIVFQCTTLTNDVVYIGISDRTVYVGNKIQYADF